MNELPESTSCNNNGTSDLDTDYLRGVKSSTCLLLPTTPSPTPLDVKHPLSEEINDGNFLNLDTEQEQMQNSDAVGDSSSSEDSNSVVQDPVSAQLINNISMLDYQTLSKNGDLIIGQVEDCKLKGQLNTSNKKLPGFVNWNWGVIRKVLLWVVLSGLVACLGTIIAMVVTLPKTCNPNLPWYQGKVFFELSPAGFKDSNSNTISGLKGMIRKLDKIQDLGVSAIRLNSIFEAVYYLEKNKNISSLLKIDEKLGVLKDFQELVEAAHKRDLHVILDLPVLSMATPDLNSSQFAPLTNGTSYTLSDPTTVALAFWTELSNNVDGFYLKNLEDFVHDPNFSKTLPIWKQIVGSNKIFIASYQAFKNAEGVAQNVLLSRIDLIDVSIDLKHGIKGLKDQINNVLNSSLWSLPHYSWVHWNIGNDNSEGITSKNVNNSLAMTVLECILPGTVNIFYGDEDEVGMMGLSAVGAEKDYPNNADLHDLVFTEFKENKSHFFNIVKELVKMRLNNPTIYMNGIYKDGVIMKNAAIKDTDTELFVIERWYPRQHTCVLVCNLGSRSVTTDLTSMFYGGTVVAATNTSLVGQIIYFDQITFPPHSAVILKLEK